MIRDGPFWGLQGIVYNPDAIRVIVFLGLEFWCNRSNPSELPLDCIKSVIQPQSSGLQYEGIDCDHPEELVLGTAGHLEEPRVRAPTLGLELQSRRNRSGRSSGPIGAQSI